jgi:hypothetical protein
MLFARGHELGMHGRLACIVEQLQFVIFGCVDDGINAFC